MIISNMLTAIYTGKCCDKNINTISSDAYYNNAPFEQAYNSNMKYPTNTIAWKSGLDISPADTITIPNTPTSTPIQIHSY